MPLAILICNILLASVGFFSYVIDDYRNRMYNLVKETDKQISLVLRNHNDNVAGGYFYAV